MTEEKQPRKKLIIIDDCSLCCYSAKDEQDDLFCMQTNKELRPSYVHFSHIEYDIPEWCPLKDAEK